MGNSITKGFAWSAVDRFSYLAIQFVLGIVIARLITPEEYGVLGILMVFINVSQVFIDSGLGSALIYKNKIDDDYLNTTFVFNLSVSVVLFIVIFFLSSIIESYFFLQRLSDYIRISSLVLITNSLIVVPSSILKIQLNFRALAISNILSTTISGCLGILAAYYGYGVWALIIQLMSKSICQLLILYLMCKWLPKLSFNKSIFIDLYRYGINIFSASCLTKIVDEGISFFIGKFLSPYSLGIFTRGAQFSALPGGTIGGVISTALFPSLSSIKNDNSRFVGVYHKAIEIQAFLCIPALIWLAVMADPLVRLLITEKWIDVVPVIQILCLSKLLSPAANVIEQVLSAKGRSDLFLRQQIWKLITKSFFVIVCLPFGLIAVVIGDAISTMAIFFITNHFAKNVSDFKVAEQLKVIAPYLLSALMSGALAIWIIGIIDSTFLQIAIGSVLFLCFYFFFLICVGKGLSVRTFLMKVINKQLFIS